MSSSIELRPTSGPGAHHGEGSRPRRDAATMTIIAVCLVIAACSWYLLQQLASLMKPLLLAVFLSYIVYPVHDRLRRKLPDAAALGVLAVLTVGVLFLLSLVVYGSALELNEEVPKLATRAHQILDNIRKFIIDVVPGLQDELNDTAKIEMSAVQRVKTFAGGLVNVAADGLIEALEVAFYLIFILLESGQFRDRVRTAFPSERADHILVVGRSINEAMANYLKLKVRASLVLAVPVTIILWAFHVKFPVIWGVLTFFGNFIPYLGGLVACGLPVLLAILQIDTIWKLILVLILLVGLHLLMHYIIEPKLTGRAINLSPLVILASLAFWGSCWGLTGMLLAVPLTVMIKIILENVAFTRPFGKLLSDD